MSTPHSTSKFTLHTRLSHLLTRHGATLALLALVSVFLTGCFTGLDGSGSIPSASGIPGQKASFEVHYKNTGTSTNNISSPTNFIARGRAELYDRSCTNAFFPKGVQIQSGPYGILWGGSFDNSTFTNFAGLAFNVNSNDSLSISAAPCTFKNTTNSPGTLVCIAVQGGKVKGSEKKSNPDAIIWVAYPYSCITTNQEETLYRLAFAGYFTFLDLVGEIGEVGYFTDEAVYINGGILSGGCSKGEKSESGINIYPISNSNCNSSRRD